jgi:hypothetical protein
MTSITMSRKESKYGQGENPKSIENLAPREPIYGVVKKRHQITVTDQGWKGSQKFVKQYGCTSISDFLEKLGRKFPFDIGVNLNPEESKNLMAIAETLGCEDTSDLIKKIANGSFVVSKSE